MKRALHLLDTLRFGGAESVALNYARLMAGWGIDTILCGRLESMDFQLFASEYAAIRTRFSFGEIRSSEYVFIHTNRNLLKVFFCRLFFRRRNKQIVYIQHLPYSRNKFRMLSWVINRVCTGFIRITPLTEELVEKFIRIPVTFIPNFYLPRYDETERVVLRHDLRRTYAVAADQKLVLFTGALKPGKGLDDFLELAGRFASDQHYRFIVAGDGGESAAIKSYPYGNLVWVGWQSDIERWLAASDVYCFCSRREMMPMALLEAQILGIPIAALSSEVNDFLLEGRTFRDIDHIQKALQDRAIPVIAPKYNSEFIREKLDEILRIGQPKKVLHIQVMPKLTGVQRVSLEIFRSLPDSEYDKTILFGSPDTPHTDYCFEQFRQAGANALSSMHLQREVGWHDWRAFREIYRLCRRKRFDIVHTHSTKPGIVGRIAARLAGVPLVVHTVHGVAFHRYVNLPRRVFYRIAEFIASFFSHRITLVATYYKKYFRFFKSKTMVIPNGIRTDRASLISTQSELGPVRLLFVGRLEEAKDPLTLLQAFTLIINRRKYQNIRLTLVGDGDLEPDCRAYIADNGLSEFITLTGWRANTADFYMDHQIFCLSSIHEAFGLCLLEAGLHALPAVATRVGGVPEVVKDGVTGYLVPSRDPEALAAAIMRLADDPDLRKNMGNAARKRVVERFNSEKMITGYKRIYNGKL